MVQDEVLEELEVFLRQALVGEVGVLRQDICSQVVMLVLAVEKDEVWEGLSREWWILQQEVELFEASGWILLNVHQGCVVERHRVQLIFIPWRHVHQGLSSGGWVLHRVFDGSLQIEGLNQSSLLEGLCIADRLDLDAF